MLNNDFTDCEIIHDCMASVLMHCPFKCCFMKIFLVLLKASPTFSEPNLLSPACLSRDVTIIQHIDIWQHLVLQYYTIWLKKILVYCNVVVILMLYVFNYYTTKITGPLVT